MSFYSESVVKKTRKPHRCSGCGTTIEVGSPALRYTGKYDRDFASHIHHPECREAEIALNRLHDVRDNDDWMSLTDMETDEHPWLLEGYPIIAARMGITAEAIRVAAEEMEQCRYAFAKPARKALSDATGGGE